MDLFKNTAIYQSQAHSESRCFKSKKKKDYSRDRMLEEQRRRGYPRVTTQETERDRESKRTNISAWKERMKGKADREQKHCRKNSTQLNTRKLICIIKHKGEKQQMFYSKRQKIKID